MQEFALIAATVVGPGLWGLAVHLVMSRLWPDRPLPLPDDSATPPPAAMPPFDYQI